MTNITTEQLLENFDSVRSLIDRGESFSLKENGVSLGTFSPIALEHRASGRRVLGGLEDEIQIPDDFDSMMRDEIEEMFYGKR